MAIKIPASKIYSIAEYSNNKNRINNSSSVYKQATVIKKAPITNSVILKLWSLNEDNSRGGYVGSIEGTNNTVAQNGSFNWDFTINVNSVAIVADGGFYYRNNVRYKATYLRFPKGTTSGFIDRFTETSFISTYNDNTYDGSNVAYFSITNEEPKRYYYKGDTIQLNIKLVTLIKETADHSMFLETLEFYIGGGNVANFEDVVEEDYYYEDSQNAETFEEDENSFRQFANTLNGSRANVAQEVLQKYSNGRSTAIIEVVQSDYYDERGNKIIGTDDRPVFENGDIVIPYRVKAKKDRYGVVTYEEVPLLNRFIVINNHISYAGILKQRLDLIDTTRNTQTYGLRDAEMPTPNSVRTDAEEVW